MIGRVEQIKVLTETLAINKSSFVAFTGRRRVGKTYLINQVYSKHFCFKVTGIQGADTLTQINNFISKIEEYSGQKVFAHPKNWQEAFLILKKYLKSLPKKKKHVIFIDELPWMCNAKSNMLQLLAHLWNDYLSAEKNFILVICGSATSWITQKIINDKGGLHNRVTHAIHLKPFTLIETKQFLEFKNIKLGNKAIADLYMAIGGIPYYLENIKRGESTYKIIDRMCFSEAGILKNEYQNLYKAIFDNPENHEAIIKALAMHNYGIGREDLIKKSKVQAGGPFTRAIHDLILSGFIIEEMPFGKIKKETKFRLTDELSVFYHRFIIKANNAKINSWDNVFNSQAYKIWQGVAFETLCLKHVSKIKEALGIKSVYTECSSFNYKGNKKGEGFQIDLLIDRKDASINLCECKYYEANFKIDKKYAETLNNRKARFRETTKTRKTIFSTLITNNQLIQNEHSINSVDVEISLDSLFKI